MIAIGDYSIPISQNVEIDEETGETTYSMKELKGRSGFTKSKKGATAEDLAELSKMVSTKLTKDAGVIAAIESEGPGSTFAPPKVNDAIGNPIDWGELTQNATLTRFKFAGIVKIQLLGVNKITQKTDVSRSYATVPTKVSSIRICRLRADEDSGPVIDTEDKRVRMF